MVLVDDKKPATSRNPLADRLFAYAKAARDDGDWAAAAELLEQVLDRAPSWAAVHVALADARAKIGDPAGAIAALTQALALDPADEQGAALRIAALRQQGPPASAPSAYVSRLFDDYAARFEAHLTGPLGYRGPDDLVAALERVDRRRFGHAIDLGCGTGLGGVALRRHSDRLTGIDLSPKMVARAAAKSLYDRLAVGSILDALADEPSGSADLVFAADVFVYVGDLIPILHQAARVLRPNGTVAFTVQRCASGFEVGADLRFAHSRAYCAETLATCGFAVLVLEDKRARQENGADVPGLVVAAAKA